MGCTEYHTYYLGILLAHHLTFERTVTGHVKWDKVRTVHSKSQWIFVGDFCLTHSSGNFVPLTWPVTVCGSWPELICNETLLSL